MYAADVTASAGKSVISPGESTELVIKVKNGSVSIDDTVVPGVDGLNINYSGSGSSYQLINGSSSSSTTLTFQVYAEKEGNYTIPPFTVTVDGQKLYTLPVNITVKKGAGGTVDGAGKNIYSDVELSKDSCYSGQPVIMRYFIYYDGNSNIELNRITRQPLADGFIVKQVNENIGSTLSARNGLNLMKVHVATYCIIPEIAGSRQTGGGSMFITYEEERGFFSRPVRSEIIFPEKKIRVMPLPERGKPAGFAGDVGEFKLEAAVKSGQYMVNQEIQVPVTVTGKGNLFVMSKPVFEKNEGIRVLVEDSEPELALSGNEITGSKKFLVTIIPQAEGSFKPGPLSIRYFNPSTGSYSVAASDPLILDIKGTVEPSVDKKDKQEDAETGFTMFAYAGAGALAAAALFGLVFIIIREKRRYAGMGSDAGKVKDEAADIKRDPVKELRGELEAAYGSTSSDSNGTAGSERLVRLMVKALDLIYNGTQAEIPEHIAEIRRKLDAARFANAALTGDEVQQFYVKVMAILK